MVMRTRRQKHSKLGKEVEQILQGEQPFFPVPPLDGSVAPGWPTFKYIIWEIFEPRDVNPPLSAILVTAWIMFLVAASSLLAVVQTLPTLRLEYAGLWRVFEYFFQIQFTIELVSRATCCPDKHVFFYKGPASKIMLNWIDVLVVVPFWVEEIMLYAAGGSAGGGNLTFIRLLRLGKGVRLVKLGRQSRGITMLSASLGSSADALQLFLLILALCVTMCSCILYFLSRGKWDKQDEMYYRSYDMGGFNYDDGTPELYDMDCWYSNYTGLNTTRDDCERYPSVFQSVPHCFWFTVVSLMTVGYGEILPITYIGQMIGAVTVLVGIVTLVLPLSIIQSSFVDERRKMKAEATEEKNYLAIRSFIEASPMPQDDNDKMNEARKKRRESLGVRAAAKRGRSFVALQEQAADELAKKQADTAGLLNAVTPNSADAAVKQMGETWDTLQQANDDLMLLPTLSVLAQQLRKTHSVLMPEQKAAEAALAIIQGIREKPSPQMDLGHQDNEDDDSTGPWPAALLSKLKSQLTGTRTTEVTPLRDIPNGAHPDVALPPNKGSRLTGKEYMVPMSELRELYALFRGILLTSVDNMTEWDTVQVNPDMEIENPPKFSMIAPIPSPRRHMSLFEKLDMTSPVSDDIKLVYDRFNSAGRSNSHPAVEPVIQNDACPDGVESTSLADNHTSDQQQSPRRLPPIGGLDVNSDDESSPGKPAVDP